MKKNSLGFTLLELLVAISIMAVLMAISIFTFRRAQTVARDNKRKADLSAVASALSLYRYECNIYPAAGSGTGSFVFGGTLTGMTIAASPSCDSRNTYMENIANDPQFPTRRYYYAPTGGAARTGYILCAYLENAPNPIGDVSGCGNNCGGACNYKITN